MAESKPNVYHGISAFDIETGEPKSGNTDFHMYLVTSFASLPKRTKNLCHYCRNAVGYRTFKICIRIQAKIFDTGIAEEHAVTFAGGLAAEGVLPFLRYILLFTARHRSNYTRYCNAESSCCFAIDRAGLVGEDGETHQGVFDVALLNPVPNLEIYSPTYFNELETAMENATASNSGPIAIRYPRGCEPYRPEDFYLLKALPNLWQFKN